MTRFLRRLLPILLLLGGACSLSAVSSYRGFYSGSLSSGAKVYFYAVNNEDVTVVVVDSTFHNFGANNTVKIDSTGKFTGTYLITTINGQIGADGVVTGNVAPLNLALTGQRAPVVGATQSLAGLYQGWVFDPNNRMLNATVMASADGKFCLYIQDGTTVTDAGYGTIDAHGIFSFTDPNGAAVSGSVIATAGGNALNGRYTKSGVGGFTFVVGRRDSANRLFNISTLSKAGDGTLLTAGFVITGGAKTVLIRGIGPTLAQFSVSSPLANPALTVYDGSVPLMTNDNWGDNANSAEIVQAAVKVGAFALPSGSLDAAVLMRLEAGQYSASVSGAGSGLALIEVYEVE